MAEVYPVLLDGVKKGTLTVWREGLTCRFEAVCEDPGRLLRLSVYGGGGEGYLGVMAPEGGRLTLRRRLSRGAMAGFPARLEYAGEAGARLRESVPPAKPPDTPPAEREQGTDLLWYRAGDGSLFTTYEGRQYRAFPLSAHGLPRGRMLEKRAIEGVEYAVFETKNGRILPE